MGDILDPNKEQINTIGDMEMAIKGKSNFDDTVTKKVKYQESGSGRTNSTWSRTKKGQAWFAHSVANII